MHKNLPLPAGFFFLLILLLSVSAVAVPGVEIICKSKMLDSTLYTIHTGYKRLLFLRCLGLSRCCKSDQLSLIQCGFFLSPLPDHRSTVLSQTYVRCVW